MFPTPTSCKFTPPYPKPNNPQITLTYCPAAPTHHSHPRKTPVSFAINASTSIHPSLMKNQNFSYHTIPHKRKKTTKSKQTKPSTMTLELVKLDCHLTHCYRHLTLSLTIVGSWLTRVKYEAVTPQRPNQDC